MKLYPLAYACRLYKEMVQYDQAYERMRGALGPSPDLSTDVQLNGLLQFLNDWSCGISEENFCSIKRSLKSWALEWIPQLPGVNADIRSLTGAERGRMGKCYEALLRTGAYHRVQDTAVTQTLHALRRHVLPAWDSAIKYDFTTYKDLADRSPGQCYSEFLKQVASQLDELERDVRRLGYRLTDVPELVERCGYSLVELMNEFFWITITKGHAVPSRAKLIKMLSWCD